ncbi:protein of unknown function [Methanoculleus bourgensis]|uniref:Uncharacterized protein n=1 Tax=Methanoculleus bourgensis TaxID=83986 RepID=A0A0X3BQH0_9EURY|nr:protein of unknown function [Methanoculleus bourgensis]
MPDAGSGLFPGSPGQWTVVAILMEVGTGEGETPSPRKVNPATPPPSGGGGSAWRWSREKPARDHDRFPGMMIALRTTNSTSNHPSSPEWSGILSNLHT